MKISRTGKAAIIINVFAILHAVTTYLLHMAEISDDLALSILTITMLYLIARLYYFPADVTAAIILIFCFAGFFLGTQGAKILMASGSEFIIKYDHSISTFAVSQLLGWTMLFIVTRIRIIKHDGRNAL
ncbi:MAG: hypothetical protein LKI53_09505 [Bacteroidales bacterium]|jgi:hypothetical protein|nr:hypothetical protein [Bacteroidales bacterium]